MLLSSNVGIVDHLTQINHSNSWELRFQDSNLCGVAGLSHGSIDTHQQIVTLCLRILDLIFLRNVSSLWLILYELNFMKSSITAIVLTLNEELNILDCLKSISLFDRVIVLDSGSLIQLFSVTRIRRRGIYSQTKWYISLL